MKTTRNPRSEGNAFLIPQNHFHAVSLSGGKDSNASVRNHHLLEKQSTYNLNGKVFVVTPVFRKEAPETLGSILFKLMQSEFAQ